MSPCHFVIGSVRSAGMNVTQQTVWPPVASAAPSAPSLSGTVEGFEALAERLAEEMAVCWRQGERPTALEYLARYQELQENTGAALKLICEEICLRKDYGQEKETGEVIGPFPQWRSQVEALLDNYRSSRQAPGGPGFPAAGEHWTDFDLVAELGRGGVGRGFLALGPRVRDPPRVLPQNTLAVRHHPTLAPPH